MVKTKPAKRYKHANVDDVYDRLTVVAQAAMTLDGKRTVVCKCSCGSPHFRVRVASLAERKTRSCGCLRDETIAEIGRRTWPKAVQARRPASAVQEAA